MNRPCFLLLAVLLVACDADGVTPTDGGGDDAGPGGPPTVVFDLEGGFFDAPYPSDLRTDAEGRPDLTGFPSRRGLLDDAATVVESERPGFSTITGVYFRFSAPVELSLLPDPAARRDESSPIWLVDVDPDSRTRGTRLPAYATYYEEQTTVWPGNTLVVRPVPGLHLAPGRRYAVALRSSLSDAIEPSPAFEALKTDASGEVGAHYDALFGALEDAGLPRDEVLNATMFTTVDAVDELDRARDFIMSQPLPTVRDWRLVSVRGDELRAEATFDTYELLEGEPPYEEFGSGNLAFGPDGMPSTVNRRAVRIGVSVPTSDVPAGGFPTVVYGHGTGGDNRSQFGREGAALAEIGVAMVGLEAVLHGDRSPGELQVENLIAMNPVAAREVVRQTVLDMILVFRLLAEGAIEVPAELNDGTPVALSGDPAMYMGHSQGSQEAGLLLAAEPSIEAAFLSAGGAGGTITIVERELTPGTRISCLIGSLIREPCEVMTEDHPAITLIIQPILEPADPLQFAHRFIRERPMGWRPLNVGLTEGLNDSFTPPRAIEALAVAIGLPIVEPVAQMSDPFQIANLPPISAPVTENLLTPQGAAVTGGLMQFPDDGHFAIYDNDDARNRYVQFFRSFVETGSATLPAPL